MRVLLISPFSPLDNHDHAAADTIVHLAHELGRRTELFVYSPTHTSEAEAAFNDTYIALAASDQTLAELGGKWSDHLGMKPVWLRRSWPKAANRDVDRYLKQIRPDVVHIEYLQAGEVALRSRPAVITLHDVTEDVMWRAFATSRGIKSVYRLAEYVRTRNFERRVLGSGTAVVVLSQSDRDVCRARTRTVVQAARIGISRPKAVWSAHVDRETAIVVFAGAMWRSANAKAAVFLAEKVMPLLWVTHPTVRLRIVGSRPIHQVLQLANVDKRIDVTGFVEDFDEEFAAADIVLAPTVLGGGVLLKLLRAMAVGCPVVTSSECARAVEADSDMLWIADNAADVSASIEAILKSNDKGAKRARQAQTYVRAAYRWGDMVDLYRGVYREVMTNDD